MFQERLMDGDTLEQAVERHYDLCDYDFMQLLKAKADGPVDDEDAFDYNDLLSEITKTSAKKIGSAQEKLQTILQKGTTTTKNLTCTHDIKKSLLPFCG